MTRITKLVVSPIGVPAFAAGIAIVTPCTFAAPIFRTVLKCRETSLLPIAVLMDGDAAFLQRPELEPRHRPGYH